MTVDTATGYRRRPTATVVITGAGTVTCQSVIKALRTQDEIDVRIVTVDAGSDVAGRYMSDEFAQVPLASDPGYVDQLLEVCRNNQADLLIPIVDYEFAPLSRAREAFRDIGCLAAISAPDVIATTNDKLRCHDFFRSNGFSTPETWSAEEARRLGADLAYPLFLKPAVDGRSSIDCYPVASPADLELYLNKVPDAMVQRLIEAPEYTADVVADWNSTALGVVVRQRIETKGGVSYKGLTVHAPEMEAEVIRMVRLLGLQGPANIQAFINESAQGEEVSFLEINPRFSGAFALSLAAGLNGPLMLVQMALGLTPEPRIGRTRIGVKMLRFWDEVFVDAEGHGQFPKYGLEPRPGVSARELPTFTTVGAE